MENNQRQDAFTGFEIAVIGMSGRFPGAKNIDEFWQNLKNGIETICFFSDDELIEAGVRSDDLEDSNYVRACGALDSELFQYFDSHFFDYNPIEAEILDPQVRLFHECCWEALEDAGYDCISYKGLVGLYSGASSNFMWETYAYLYHKRAGLDGFSKMLLAEKDNISTRISYKLNLQGPAVTVQTACSTSLVAIHQACRALLMGECDMALAGGITIKLPQKNGYIYQQSMILSPDGHCRAFADTSLGTNGGSGGGIVVLKRLGMSIEDGDHIYAVIKGSGINNDGNRKVGFTAPSVEGQVEAIDSAIQMAEVSPDTIEYIEAHGTGTILGDPIELKALKEMFRTEKRGFCAIGSVKSNIGHLDSAAGVAGFIKAVLSIKHQLILPSLHFENPNPKLGIEDSPFYINRELKKWERKNHPLRAGVSSFGIGGTNAHVILEEAPDLNSDSAEINEAGEKYNSKTRPYQLILLSAKSKTSLENYGQNLKKYFTKNPGINIADAAYTLQIGRCSFKHRQMWLCSDVKEAIDMLSKPGGGRFYTLDEKKGTNKVVFMFPGQGSQYIKMGLELYQEEPLFREHLDQCFAILQSIKGLDLKKILYAKKDEYRDGYSLPENDRDDDTNSKYINRTEIAQPLIFSLEYALAKMLMKWGISPFAMIGHSIGEYVAAHLAGVFSLEEALHIVTLRGELMSQMPEGSMLSVSLPENEILSYINSDLSLAAVNAPSLCTVSGPTVSINSLKDQLNEKGHNCSLLHTSHAFHSALMDPILQEFENKIKAIDLKEPKIPFISNLTGDWITIENATAPHYWADHLRNTVRFNDGIKKLLIGGTDLFIEVGPGNVLTSLVRRIFEEEPNRKALNMMRHPRESISDMKFFMKQMGQLWLYGEKINWNVFYEGDKRKRVSLPTYPFDGKYCWPQVGSLNDKTRVFEENSNKILEKRNNCSDWFYTQLWEKSILNPRQHIEITQGENWLIFTDDCGVSSKLIEAIKSEVENIIIVKPGNDFVKKDTQDYILNPTIDKHFIDLVEQLKQDGIIPHKILHLWSLEKHRNLKVDDWKYEHTMNMGYYSLLAMVKAIAINRIAGDQSIGLNVVSNELQEVIGNEHISPLKAVILGVVKTISQEYSNINCRCIDIDLSVMGTSKEKNFIKQFLAEITMEMSDQIVAYRYNKRWIPVIRPLKVDRAKSMPMRLKERGVYLITGGLGGIGFSLAEYIAKEVKGRLILVNRSSFPQKSDWNRLIENIQGIGSDYMINQIKRMRQWEESGASVMIVNADVANEEQMQEVIERVKKCYGAINGVIHSAGVPDGSIIQQRTRDESERVFQSKIKGTLVLDHVLKDFPLDFFILCSSLSSILAPMGQVAYSSANAFLDAFAYYKTQRDGLFTLSINWDMWQEVGMAVDAMSEWWEKREVAHPLFAWCEQKRPAKHLDKSFSGGSGGRFFKKAPLAAGGKKGGEATIVYISHFNIEKNWILNEHRVMGQPTLPGTAYIEIVRAAFSDFIGKDQMEISDLYFLKPLVIEGGERVVQTTLKKEGDIFEFKVMSCLGSIEEGWETHAIGKIKEIESFEQKKCDIREIQNRCLVGDRGKLRKIQEISKEDETQQQVLVTGPRWNNFKGITVGNTEGIIELELADEFVKDLDFYKFHPALMDLATVFLSSGIKKTDNPEINYVPFSIGNIKFKSALQKSIYSYARVAENSDPQKKTQVFNIAILDNSGLELVEIEGFTVLGISMGKISEQMQFNREINEEKPKENVVENPLKDGILSNEGIDVFARLLDINLPGVVVSTRDLEILCQQYQRGISKSDGKDGMEEDDSNNKSMGPIYQRPELSTPYIEPRTPMESKLTDIIKNFFGIDAVGIKDDFFELGGDSLKAISLTTLIHKELNVDVQVADFFTKPTVEQLAEFIGDSSGESHYISLKPQEEKEYYPLSSPQKRLYLHQKMQLNSISYNLPQTLQVDGELDKDYFNKAFQSLIKRHEILRTSFQLINDIPVQLVHRDLDFQVTFGEILEDDLKEVIDSFVRPFHLDQAPLIRMEVYQFGKKKYACLFDIHHILTDASGYAILIKELMKIYNGEELTPIRIHYKDYSKWLQEYIYSSKNNKQEKYWLNVLSGEIPRLNFPKDYPEPEIYTFDGASYVFTLNREDYLKYKTVGSAVGATIFMNLLASLYILLFKYTGHSEIIIGSSVAGRPHADLQEMLGMFVNILLLRNKLDSQQSYINFLERVKTNTLEAFENQDFQFDMLMERLNLIEDNQKNPFPEVCINVENYEQPSFKMEDLSISYLGLKNKASKFPITLWANENSDGLRFILEYSIERYSPQTIEKIAERYILVMKQIIKNPDIQIKDIILTHNFQASEKEIPHMDFEF